MADIPVWPEEQVMRYCAEHGIPRSVFLGRVVRPGEPLWLPEDAAAALRWQAEQDALCPGCRQPRRESFTRGNRYRIDAHKCAACSELGHKSWAAGKNRSKNAPPAFGVYYTATKLEA